MPAPRLFKTEAVILRQRRVGEADRFLTLFTPALGKIEAKAKGVRKTTSRMSGHLQPLTRCMLQLAQGHVTDVVTGCETLESFQPLRGDLAKLSRALYMGELVDRMLPEAAPAYATYRLLVESLRRLEGAEDADLPVRFFEMRMLDQAGFRPEAVSCVGCGSKLEAEQSYFAPQSGGVACRRCGAEMPGTRVLTLNAFKVLRLLQRGSYNDVARLHLDADLGVEVERHLRAYIVCVLERDVNAAAFIERLRREDVLQPVEV
jgi:DNA repair protein RecO (recombination protein O)